MRLLPLRFGWAYGLCALAMTIQLAAEVTAASQRGAQWRGDLIWTLDWVAVSFIIVAPVLAGLAAVDTARLARAVAILDRDGRRRTSTSFVFLGHAASAWLCHLAVVLGVLVVSKPPVWDDFALLAVTAQLLMLAVFIAVGCAVGRVARPLVAGGAAALMTVAGMYLLTSPGQSIRVLEFGSATTPRIGYAYSGRFLAIQSACLAGIVTVLLLVRIDLSRATSSRRRLLPLAAAVACMALAWVPALGGRRLKTIEQPATSCATAVRTPVCLVPQHQRVADRYAGVVATLVQAADAGGLQALVPKRFEEATRTRLPLAQDGSVAPIFVSVDTLRGSDPRPEEIVQGALEPIHCPQLANPPSERYGRDLSHLMLTWMSALSPGYSETNGGGSPLPPAAASTLLHQFRTCTYPHFND